jgi:hypothetical protein
MPDMITAINTTITATTAPVMRPGFTGTALTMPGPTNMVLVMLGLVFTTAELPPVVAFDDGVRYDEVVP